jgi:hypothetical protein
MELCHPSCPTCGSYCNERDELDKAEREITRLRGLLEQAAVEVVRADTGRAQIVAAERERCAKVAESWATEETATTCANVAAAIRGA